MKQTAVEQFIKQLEQQGNSWENASIESINISIKVEDYLKLKEQAKQMEKQQIEQAFNEGDLFSHNYNESGEKYYIYTFEK